ncbi:MAG: aminopeptidase [Solirubrobacteraceae bacterium]
MDLATLERFADLVVRFGANVQPGQVVSVGTEIGKEEVTRALVASAYRHGAKFVDVSWFDPHSKRARVLHADPGTLDWVPPWYGERMLALGEVRAARIGLTGPVEPELFDDLDPALVGRDQLPFVREIGQVVNERTTNWTAAPAPTAGWAELVHPELEPAEALERLWRDILHVCRLDEPDPIAAWEARMDVLDTAAERLGERRFDALHFEGPGTDLRVGLLPSSRWISARFSTAEGLRHQANLPSEEIFATPDPARADGVVRATKPLVAAGATIEGLEVEFADGRVSRIDAERGSGTLRSLAERDEGAARLGEVALVDGDGRIGPIGRPFYDTLLDENAASHVALGSAYAFAVDESDEPRINRSAIHVDFMIGSNEVDVTGLTDSGERVPVLRGGAWQL